MATSAAASTGFVVGDGVRRAQAPTPYRRRLGDPVLRVLRVFTQDPGLSRSDGAIAEIAVPWEPLGPGPSGSIFTVRDVHHPTGDVWAPVDLDDPWVAVDRGIAPSTTDPRFAQQMTYAVAPAPINLGPQTFRPNFIASDRPNFHLINLRTRSRSL